MSDSTRASLPTLKNLRGQSCVLQSSTTVAFPSQVPTSSVPSDSSIFFVLKLVRDPPAHVTEHSPTCQSFHSQSIAGSKYKCLDINRRCYTYITYSYNNLNFCVTLLLIERFHTWALLHITIVFFGALSETIFSF